MTETMKKLLLVFVLLLSPWIAFAGGGEIGVRWWDRDLCVTFDHCEETYRMEINLRVNVLPEGGLWDKFEFAPVVQNLRVRESDIEKYHATPVAGWFGFEAVVKPVDGLRIAIGGTSEHFFDGILSVQGDGLPGRTGNYIEIRWDF